MVSPLLFVGQGDSLCFERAYAGDSLTGQYLVCYFWRRLMFLKKEGAMPISKEFGEAIAKIKEGLGEVKAGATRAMDFSENEALEASYKALDEADESLAKVKGALLKARASLAEEAETVQAAAKEHLDSAEESIAEADKELTEAAVKAKAKSKEVAEEAITRAKELLDKAEGLLAKIK